MFEDFYVRISADQFLEDWHYFKKNNLNPEIYLDGTSLENMNADRIEIFKSILTDFDSNTIHAPFLDISTGGVDCDIRDLSFIKLNKTLEIGRAWNSYLVVVHYNYDHIYYREHKDLWLKNSSCFFKKLLGNSPPLIAIENIADPDPMMAVKLEKKVNNKNLIHCFDFGHHRVFGKISFKKWMSYFNSKNPIHFHFHDNHGDGDEHLPIGEGDINWEEVKSFLSGLPCSFTVTLEPHSKRSLEKSLAFYRDFFL